MNELYQFSKQDLILVSQIKKRQNISAIFYHFWINLVNPEEKFVFVDTIEIVFDTTNTYFFKINEEDSGYTISTTYNFEEEQKMLAEKFQEVLSLKRVDVSAATIWKDKIKTPLLSVNTVNDYENRNENFIHFDFVLLLVKYQFVQYKIGTITGHYKGNVKERFDRVVICQLKI